MRRFRSFRVRLPSGERYWTVLGAGYRPVPEADEWLLHVRLGRDCAEEHDGGLCRGAGVVLRVVRGDRPGLAADAGSCLTATAAVRQIDTERSMFTIHVGKAGLFSAAGHEHEVRARFARGSMDAGSSPHIEFVVDARTLTVMPDADLSPDKQAEVQQTMHTKVLESEKISGDQLPVHQHKARRRAQVGRCRISHTAQPDQANSRGGARIQWELYRNFRDQTDGLRNRAGHRGGRSGQGERRIEDRVPGDPRRVFPCFAGAVNPTLNSVIRAEWVTVRPVLMQKATQPAQVNRDLVHRLDTWGVRGYAHVPHSDAQSGKFSWQAQGAPKQIAR